MSAFGAGPVGPWDPAVLERVRALHLHAREAVWGLHHGAHRSLRAGHEVEFLDYKPYDRGDSLRDLDWRVLARTDRLVVRRYRAEQELAATLVFDASADLGSVPAKFETAVRLAATIAYLVHLDGGPVGLTVLAGEGHPPVPLPARRGRSHLARLFLTLAAVRPAGRAGLGPALREVGGRLGSRSLVAVVSDFMEDPAAWAPELAALTRQRVDLRAFQVYDRDELELAGAEPVRLRSPETGDELPVDPVAARAAFLEVRDAWLTELDRAFAAHRGLRSPVAAGEDLGPVLARFLAGVA